MSDTLPTDLNGLLFKAANSKL